MLDLILQLLLLLLALPALVSCIYLFACTLLSGKPDVPKPRSRELRFDIVVPAHNESAIIARNVASLRRIDWPAQNFRVLVVADNCSDDTAAVARAAGAHPLERQNASLRGKGYALDHAFQFSLADGFASAVVVIDADAEVSPNLLQACAARIERGAEAVQVHYGILNPEDSWRTRLLTIAKAAFHIVRSRARERLQLSCGIRGNGWCLTHALMRRVPYNCFSLAEDIEYSIALGMQGVRVHYADEAHADADMVSGAAASGVQRQRWEGGRFAMLRSATPTLIRAAITRRSALCADLAMDLIVLPLSYVALNVALLLALARLAVWWNAALTGWLGLALACGAMLVIYVMRGWQISGTGARGLLDLARAPFFVLWKLVVMLRRGGSREWVRTERETPGK